MNEPHAASSSRQRAKYDKAKAARYAKKESGKWILVTGNATYFSVTKKKRTELIERLRYQGKLNETYRTIDPT